MNKILNKLTVTDLNLSESGGVGSLQFRKGFQSGMEDQVSSIVENNRIKSHLNRLLYLLQLLVISNLADVVLL